MWQEALKTKHLSSSPVSFCAILEKGLFIVCHGNNSSQTLQPKRMDRNFISEINQFFPLSI